MDRLKTKKPIRFFALSALAAIFLLLVIWSFAIEPNRIEIVEKNITISGWHKEHKNLKVAVLSDFHIGFGVMDREKLNSIIKLTNSLKPDLVLLLGDYVNVSDKNKVYLKYLLDFKKFQSKYGVYGVLGNHESWQVQHEIRKNLREANVNILENRAERVSINGKSFWIAGIEDVVTGYPDLNYILKQINSENPIIFLSHNPQFFNMLPAQVDLAIAGHTHGGQLNIPVLVNLLNRSPFASPYLRGYMQKKGQQFYITSGLGTTIIPARFLVTPEIVILNIN